MEKCLECEKENKKPKTINRYSHFMNETFFDTPSEENGRVHWHTDRIFTNNYECSNGHKFTTTDAQPCISCYWDWKK